MDAPVSRYRLPPEATGLIFGPHGLFGYRLWFVRADGTIRRATRRELRDYRAAFPALTRTVFRRRSFALPRRGSEESVRFAPSL